MFSITPENLSTLELVVEKASKVHEHDAFKASCLYSRFFHLESFDSLYSGLSVKYNDRDAIECEHAMLQYLYTLACEDGESSPHVPQPIHFFHKEGPWGYIVMERIQQLDVPRPELDSKTVDALRWLHSKHPPGNATFGTIGPTPSYPYHHVFKYNKAPRKFNTSLAVEKYLNLALPRASKFLREPLSNISLTGDEVVLSQSDIHPSNFGVAPDGRPIIFDAATIHAMPLSLANVTLLISYLSKHLFTQEEKAALLQTPTIYSLARVMRFLTSVYEFIPPGLDHDGNIAEGFENRKW